MRRFKQGAALALATVAALAGTFATGSPAMAASSPIGACGGGSYRVVDKHDLGKAVIYLMYNGTTNCVVTWKDKPDRKKVGTGIRSYNHSDWDFGYYSTYAGPSKIKAKGECIQWQGHYGDKGFAGYVWWQSRWGHCG
ncbi:spore-associated protein A [Streptosporangium sp. KLBMP 9127]|nr:spore-associated protein A [Streptosporangium sp. KLBMP 9127]